MKRIIAVLMVIMLVFAFAACGNKEDNKEGNNGSGTPAAVTESYVPVEILTTVWESYTTADEVFPAAGGDMLTETTTNWEGPAAFGIEGEDALGAMNNFLHFPTESASKLSDAASLMHAMNGNIFTCGAFKVANTAELDALVGEIKTSIDNTQWMCGFPEKLLIAKVGDNIISCFGNTSLVDAFGAKLTAAYNSTVVVIDEAIVA